MSEAFDPLYTWLGIPPEEQPPDYYRLLGLCVFEDNADVIECAADRQMAYIRTVEAGPHAGLAQELLNHLAAARVCLLDPVKKAEYDAWLRQRLGPPPTLAAPPVSVPATAAEAEAPELAALIGPMVPPSPRPAPPRPRKRTSFWLALSIGGILVGAGAAGATALVLWWIGSNQGKLELTWPDGERAGSVLYLDGKELRVEPGQALIFPLPEGDHHVRLLRPGYEPFEQHVTILVGQTVRVRPVWRLPELKRGGPIAGAGESGSREERPGGTGQEAPSDSGDLAPGTRPAPPNEQRQVPPSRPDTPPETP